MAVDGRAFVSFTTGNRPACRRPSPSVRGKAQADTRDGGRVDTAIRFVGFWAIAAQVTWWSAHLVLIALI